MKTPAARPPRVYPRPEVIDPAPTNGRWKIVAGRGSTAMVDLNARSAVLPLDDTPQARDIRKHEMGHVRWSPRRLRGVNGINPVSIQAAEDCRINARLRIDAGLSLDNLVPDAENPGRGFAPADLMADSLHTAACKVLCSLNTGLQDTMLASVKALREHDDPGHRARGTALATLASRAKGLMTNDTKRKSFQTAVKLAKVLDMLVPDPTPDPKDGGDPKAAPGDPMDAPSTDSDGRPDLDAMRMRDALGDTGRSSTRPRPGGRPAPGPATSPWGTLLPIHRPPLTRAYKAHKRPDRRPGDDGTVFAYPDRYCVDQKIFVKPTPKAGGTVLIDTSGSMSLSVANIEEIMAAAPAATVAIYSGRDTEGQLRIVGFRGRRVEADQLCPYGGGNIVDGPCLEWLAKQPMPRIWVSDGLVTGPGDAMAGSLTAAAVRICTAGKIYRADNAAQAAVGLKKGRQA